MATEVLERGRAPRTTEKRTIPSIWRRATTESRSFPAYLVETEDGWREVSWTEAGARVEAIAHGLLDLGIRKGDAVAIVSWSRLEWALIDFALARIGAVCAPVYANLSPADTQYAIALPECVAAFVEDDEQLAKVEGVRDGLPTLRDLLTFDQLQQLEERGRAHRERDPEALERAEAEIDEEDLFTYIYTSGTTGPAKACMIRHRNHYEMVTTIDKLPEFTMRGDVVLLFLPLAHNYGRTLHLLGAYAGYTIAFLPDPLRVADALPDVRPTVLPSVPRVYEKIHGRVKAQFDSTTGVRRRLVDWALRVGHEASPYKLRDESLPRGLAAKHRIADRLVYSKVKKRLGGRLRVAISGAAPIAADVLEFFHALDILILEGYGQSEMTTACSVNVPGRVKFGTVGPILPDFDVRIAEDGEILVKSETVFAGYYRDEAATREVLTDDGWLHTGDVGDLDEDGFLRITDRKKDIIVTAGGKNIAPQNVENALKHSKLVSQALVIGDRRPYLVALLTLDEEEAAGMNEEQRRAAVEAAVEEANSGLSRFEQIKRFAIVPRDFSAEEGEVTPTMKLRRRTVEQHFAGEIEKLYVA